MDLNSSPGPVRRGRGALWIAGLGLALVIAAAFVLTYDGLYATAVAGGVRPKLAFLYPMVFDGFLAVAFAAALVLRSVGLRATWYPWALIIVLLAAVGGANVLYALGREAVLPPDLTRLIVAAVPPVALGLAFPLWLLMFAYVRGGRRTRAAGGNPAGNAVETPTDSADIVPGLRQEEPAKEAQKEPQKEPVNEQAEESRGTAPSEGGRVGKPERPEDPEKAEQPAEPEGSKAADDERKEHDQQDDPERVLGSGLPFRRRPATPSATPSATPPSGKVRSSPTPPDA